MSPSEKVLLVEEIWDSIAEDKIVLTKQHKAVLEDRFDIAKNTTERVTWNTINKKVRETK